MASASLRDVTLFSVTSSCVEELRGYVVQREKRGKAWSALVLCVLTAQF